MEPSIAEFITRWLASEHPPKIPWKAKRESRMTCHKPNARAHIVIKRRREREEALSILASRSPRVCAHWKCPFRI